jgi:hypothetical protein
MTLASKLSYVVTEEEEVEDVEENSSRRQTIVRRLARGLQTAQDFGLVLGNGVTAFLLWYTQPGGCSHKHRPVLVPYHSRPHQDLCQRGREQGENLLPFKPFKYNLQTAVSRIEECNFWGGGGKFLTFDNNVRLFFSFLHFEERTPGFPPCRSPWWYHCFRESKQTVEKFYLLR